jgi:pimeloyl-ACP methyl ester carboxylesterase
MINRKGHNRFVKAVIYFSLFINLVAFFHAYKFTHFSSTARPKTKDVPALSWSNKLGALLFGVSNPRPVNMRTPGVAFEAVYVPSGSERLECWRMRTPDRRGTVALFHGYSGCKSGLLDKAAVFLELGFDVLLVDFAGSGGSTGRCTTIGYREADDVKACLDFLSTDNADPVVLFGTSMGAAAVLCAADRYGIQPAAAVLECPFGSMYATTCARFREMGVPSFPMAGLLVFWGGAQHGFWAFGHNPTTYAQKAHFPVLLLYGEKDAKVSRTETESIFEQLPGTKVLHTYADAGHENYLLRYGHAWCSDVAAFLANLPGTN